MQLFLVSFQMAFEFESLLAVFVVAYERSDIKLWYTINETKCHLRGSLSALLDWKVWCISSYNSRRDISWVLSVDTKEMS